MFWNLKLLVGLPNLKHLVNDCYIQEMVLYLMWMEFRIFDYICYVAMLQVFMVSQQTQIGYEMIKCKPT